MRAGELVDRAGSRLGSIARSSKLLYGCIVALLFISAADVAIVAFGPKGTHKLGPNLCPSPWDLTLAPAQCKRRSDVRITGLARDVLPKPPSRYAQADYAPNSSGWSKPSYRRYGYKRSHYARAGYSYPADSGAGPTRSGQSQSNR